MLIIIHTIVLLLGSGPFLWLKNANTIKMILDFCVAKNPSRAIIFEDSTISAPHGSPATMGVLPVGSKCFLLVD